MIFASMKSLSFLSSLSLLHYSVLTKTYVALQTNRFIIPQKVNLSGQESLTPPTFGLFFLGTSCPNFFHLFSMFMSRPERSRTIGRRL